MQTIPYALMRQIHLLASKISALAYQILHFCLGSRAIFNSSIRGMKRFGILSDQLLRFLLIYYLFGFPLFRGISEVMPNVSCTLPELEKNKTIWEQRIIDEKARKEARGDGRRSPRTYGSVGEAEVEEARTRKRESEPMIVPTEIPQTPSTPVSRQPLAPNRGSPTAHPAAEQRHTLQLGLSPNSDEKRSSTPVLWPSSLQLSPPFVSY